MMELLQIIGPIKIKDALFIGDEVAAQDLDFVMTNKVTHVINCAGRQIPNHWEPIAVRYLTYYWMDQEIQTILDVSDKVARETYNFIDNAIQKGDSVLVHSVNGLNRAGTIVTAFLMRKYRWTLQKTIQFMLSRRPDFRIRPSFMHQLNAYEARLLKMGLGAKTSDWNSIQEDADVQIQNEELLLRNTYLNSQMGPLAVIYQPGPEHKALRFNQEKPAIKWQDQHPMKRSPSKSPTKHSPKVAQQGKLASFMPTQDLMSRARTIKITEHHRVEPSTLKSALRKSGGINGLASLEAAANNIQKIGSQSPRRKGAELMDDIEIPGDYAKKRPTPEMKEPRKLTNNFLEEKKSTTPRKEAEVNNAMYQLYGSAAGQQRAEGITNIINNHNINNIYIQTPQIEIVEKNEKRKSQKPAQELRTKRPEYINKEKLTAGNRVGGGSLGALRKDGSIKRKQIQHDNIPTWRHDYARAKAVATSAKKTVSKPIADYIQTPGGYNIPPSFVTQPTAYRAHQPPPGKSQKSITTAQIYKPIYPHGKMYHHTPGQFAELQSGIFQPSQRGVIINNFTGAESAQRQPSGGPKPLKATEFDFMKKFQRNEQGILGGHSFSQGPKQAFRMMLREKQKKQRPSTAPTRRPPSPGRGQSNPRPQAAEAPGLISSGYKKSGVDTGKSRKGALTQQAALSSSLNFKHGVAFGAGPKMSSKIRHVSPAVGGSASASAITTLHGLVPVKGNWKI